MHQPVDPCESERAFLRADIAAVERLLRETPADYYGERLGLEDHRTDLVRELWRLPGP